MVHKVRKRKKKEIWGNFPGEKEKKEILGEGRKKENLLFKRGVGGVA